MSQPDCTSSAIARSMTSEALLNDFEKLCKRLGGSASSLAYDPNRPYDIKDKNDVRAELERRLSASSETKRISQHELMDMTADMLEAHDFGAEARAIRKAKKEMPDCPVTGLWEVTCKT